MTTTRTTLTDRYVWIVTRHLSAETGPDVARELRGTIADAVEDRTGGGGDPEEAERAVLTELGDPEVLARQYGGRPDYLIGPGLFPDYVRLVRVLLAVVLPTVLLAHLVARAVTGDLGWDMLGSALALVFSVGVQLVFWVSVTFAIIERSRPESERGRSLTSWDPDRLPEEAPGRSVSLGETVWSVAFSLALAALVTWQFAGVGPNGIQVLNPDVALGWQVVLVAMFVVDAVLAVAVWRAGRWTPTLAAVNVVSNVGAAVLIIWLLLRGELLTDLPEVLGETFGTTVYWGVSTGVVAMIVVVIAVWDALDSVLKARRASMAGPF